MLYFKYKNNDEINAAIKLSSSKFNEWIEMHHYGTCSYCRKEYLYEDSPVLKDHIWQKVVNTLGLTKLNDYCKSKKPIAKAYKAGSIEEQIDTKMYILRVVPDSEHCTICKECMEKALNKKLTNEDLKICGLNDNFIKKFNL